MLSPDNEVGQTLLQIQNNRFTLNWRRGSASQQYPRYVANRDMFRRLFGEFCRFIEETDIGPLTITQAEVSYINLITLTEALPLGPISPWRKSVPPTLPLEFPGFLRVRFVEIDFYHRLLCGRSASRRFG